MSNFHIHSLQYLKDVERLAGLNIHSMKFLQNYFRVALARSAYYLREALIFTEKRLW